MTTPPSCPPSLPLHIVEPTLSGEAGHCMSLVRALSAAAAQAGCHDITVWGGRTAATAAWVGPGQLRAHFHRRWRRLQALALYRQLLRQPGRVLVSTAGSADLVSLDWAARLSGSSRIPRNKVTLFVHWLKVKPGKARLYSAIARRQPDLKILAPTAGVVEFFQTCGFAAQQVAYPLDASGDDASTHPAPPPFQHLLVPGAARMDKGFGHIVDLVEAMQQRGLTWPIFVQTSLEHGHHKDQDLAAALARLSACGYPGLVQCNEALDRNRYHALFEGAVVIQPYRATDFEDRVSGVTLDALRAGAPIVVTEGTWMARLVQRHHAGVATSDLSPSGLIHAIETILADHRSFAERARQAASQVLAEHSASGLIQAVLAES